MHKNSHDPQLLQKAMNDLDLLKQLWLSMNDLHPIGDDSPSGAHPLYVLENERATQRNRCHDLLSRLQDALTEIARSTRQISSPQVLPTDQSLSHPTELRVLTERLEYIEEKNRRLTAELNEMLHSHSWRLTKPIRLTITAVRRSLRIVKAISSPGQHGKQARNALARSLYHRLPAPLHFKRLLRQAYKRLLFRHAYSGYEGWIRQNDTLSREDVAAIQEQIATWVSPPTISVIMPTYNSPEQYLRKAIESVRKQIYPYWELCIADDASTQSTVRQILNEYAEVDPRIKVIHRAQNGHISASSNDALSLATGQYVALLDHDDELPIHALYWLAAEIISHPEVELLYSDEDKINENGKRSDPYFKPDWNPELLLGQNYISHLGCYKRARVVELEGFREGFEGCQDWDLVLRFTDNLDPQKIRHIPAVLYHWRMLANSTASDLSAKPYVTSAAIKTLSETLERRSEQFTLKDTCNGAFYVPSFKVTGTPIVSIIIPTRNGLQDLKLCLDSLQRTDYIHYEILIIDNQSDDPDTIAYLAALRERPGYQVLSYPYPFDYAAMHNWAVPQARGEFLCLLNNDTEVFTSSWLDEMLGEAQRPGVGAVGAKLLYPNGSIQHAGVILGMGGIADHAHKSYPGDAYGHYGRASLVQNFSAVTAACMVIRKSLWEEMGGMSPELAVAYNDVDLCLHLVEAGYRNVWVPQAVLYHHESKTRGADIAPAKMMRFAIEHAYMQWRWGRVLQNDPAYNPNQALDYENFTLAATPRVQRPWRDDPLKIDVPYGLPLYAPAPLSLVQGDTIKGSFPVPYGIKGTLNRFLILMGNYSGTSNGILVCTLEDHNGQSGTFEADLTDSEDNTFLTLGLTQGKISLNGQERLSFHFQTENATRPVALFAYPLVDPWSHQISGHEDCALRIILLIT